MNKCCASLKSAFIFLNKRINDDGKYLNWTVVQFTDCIVITSNNLGKIKYMLQQFIHHQKSRFSNKLIKNLVPNPQKKWIHIYFFRLEIWRFFRKK